MTTLACYALGHGPKVTVLLHGLLGSGRNLRTLATSWASRDPLRRFLVPDLLGHGQSPPWVPQGTSDPGLSRLPALRGSASRDLADAVCSTLDAEGLRGPVHLVGHSLGARVTLAAARLDPSRIEHVTMLDMAPGPIDASASPSRTVLNALLRAPAATNDRRAMRDFLLREGQEPGIADWLLMNLAPQNGEYAWRIDRQTIARLHDDVIAEDLWPVVESRTVPVCCIRGERSSYVTDADAARMQHAGHAVHTLAGAGHYVHVDALPALLDVLTA